MPPGPSRPPKLLVVSDAPQQRGLRPRDDPLPEQNPRAWEFSSWQNLTAAGLLFGWVVAILIRRKHTPLELICPSLNEKLVRARSRYI